MIGQLHPEIFLLFGNGQIFIKFSRNETFRHFLVNFINWLPAIILGIYLQVLCLCKVSLLSDDRKENYRKSKFSNFLKFSNFQFLSTLSKYQKEKTIIAMIVVTEPFYTDHKRLMTCQ